MYETLLAQPLFQGMSHSDLEQVVGHTRFDFSNVAAQELIAAEGERSDGIFFITAGTLSATGESDDHSYSLCEHLSAPWTIEPERLFGLNPRYSRTYQAETSCRIFRIGKEDVVTLANQFEVFRLNLLNIYTTHAQRLSRQVWHTPPQGIKEKIARFVAERCLVPVGEKTVDIKMTTLAHLIGESRLNVSHALHALSEEGLATLWRGGFCISQLEHLLTSHH